MLPANGQQSRSYNPEVTIEGYYPDATDSIEYTFTFMSKLHCVIFFVILIIFELHLQVLAYMVQHFVYSYRMWYHAWFVYCYRAW